jgi:U3 small nucleolar RNA-associated protein 18
VCKGGADAEQVHTASATAYANWPNAGTPLGVVRSVDFAPAGGYVAVGNERGRVGLWSIQDWAG